MKTVYSAVPLALMALAARADIINNNYNDNNHFHHDIGNPVGNAIGNTNANGNSVGDSVNVKPPSSPTPTTIIVAPTTIIEPTTVIPIEFIPHGPHHPEEPESSCSTSVASPSTLTRTETQTYCPKCSGHRPTPPVWTPAPAPEQTVYTTVWEDLCPTGVTSVTYTITEQCPCTATRPAHHIPSGYTSTVKTCDTCGPTPITKTCTVPITTAPSSPSVTVYTTAFKDICSTGVTSRTYTVTENWPGTTTRPADHVPEGFTSTVKSCHSCGPTPITETCTVPIETAPGSVVPTTWPAPAPKPEVPTSVNPVTTPAGTGYHPIPHAPSASSTVIPFTGGAVSLFSGAAIAMSLVAGVFGAIAVAL